MPQFKYPLKTAAQLAKASYSAQTHPSVSGKVARSIDKDDVQAHLLDNGVLLIPGSNSLMDYIRFNLRVLNIGGKRYKMSTVETEKGASGTRWHQGFLRHAKTIYDWVEDSGTKPTYIIGHSLGAAATQILCKSWRVSGVGFAAPRPRRNAGRIAGDRFCLCMNRADDLVTTLPSSFFHVGHVTKWTGVSVAFRPEHSMDHYQDAVAEAQAAGKLPETWPA